MQVAINVKNCIYEEEVAEMLNDYLKEGYKYIDYITFGNDYTGVFILEK